MHRWIFAFIFLSPGIFFDFAWSQQPAGEDSWEQIKARQPGGVQLELNLNKKRFVQGEKIEAQLLFSNSGKTHYSTQFGAGARIAVFHATTADGKAATDPMQWYHNWNPTVVTGAVASYSIAGYHPKAVVNEELCFDLPGEYSLYAEAVIYEGKDFNPSLPIPIVSPKVQIVIEAPTSKTEKELIAAAHSKMDPDQGRLWEGFTELGYLRSPAGYEEMLPFLNREDFSWRSFPSLLSAPDPAALAPLILEKVKQGQLVLNVEGVELYTRLKTYPIFAGKIPQDLPETESTKMMKTARSTIEEARQEILDAQNKAAENGPHLLKALWAAFKADSTFQSPGAEQSRKALAEHQFELSQTQVDELLALWEYRGSVDFLPLVKKQVAAPIYNPRALAALAQLKPDEALPLISADITAKTPHYFIDDDPVRWQRMPAQIMPPLNAFLKKALPQDPGNRSRIFDFVEQYGTKALLPEIATIYNGLKWSDSRKDCLLKYRSLRLWIRFDPENGVKALAKALPQTVNADWSQPVIDVLIDNWTPLATPLVLKELERPEVQRVDSAVHLLVNHTDEKYADLVLAAMERAANTPGDQDPGWQGWRRSEQARLAKYLLAIQKWNYTLPQKLRLQALADGGEKRR